MLFILSFTRILFEEPRDRGCTSSVGGFSNLILKVFGLDLSYIDTLKLVVFSPFIGVQTIIMAATLIKVG